MDLVPEYHRVGIFAQYQVYRLHSPSPEHPHPAVCLPESALYLSHPSVTASPPRIQCERIHFLIPSPLSCHLRVRKARLPPSLPPAAVPASPTPNSQPPSVPSPCLSANSITSFPAFVVVRRRRCATKSKIPAKPKRLTPMRKAIAASILLCPLVAEIVR